MDLDISGILLGVFGLIATVAAMLAAVIWGNVQGLRSANADLRLRVTDLESSNLTLKAENVELKSSLRTLTQNISGEVHWEALSEVLEHHHRDAIQHWEKETGAITDMRDLIKESTSLLADILREERRGA